ncbi:MAG: glycosyltransferase family 9 protein, partial [Schleiferiaceae bacterium]|nr:glycosyltransferase family 9 protein [Schleiferiaceae bacterium]
PELRITVLSRKPFHHFFPDSDRLHFEAVDTKGEHKGLRGLRRLYKQLWKKYEFNAVADFHNVLRSQVITGLFNLKRIPSAAIKKGRADKKLLTLKKGKVFIPLKHSSRRYADVLKKLGVKFKFDEHELKAHITLSEKAPLPLNTNNIGLAPFAQHKGKALPFEKVKELVEQLSKNTSNTIFLFGGGEKEVELLSTLEGDNVVSLAGKFSLPQELAQIAALDVMISMDSANMHMASLVGTKTVSVWGATHYFAGFLGIGQTIDNVVEVSHEELPCRPCSVFGNKPCYRKDYACLNLLTAQQIRAKTEAVLNH